MRLKLVKFGLIVITFSTAYAQEPYWGVGMNGACDLPMVSLAQRFKPALNYGTHFGICLQENRALQIYAAYTVFKESNKLHEKLRPRYQGELVAFLNEVQAEMSLFQIWFNMVNYFSANKLRPYFAYGGGFYAYEAEIFRQTEEGQVGLRLISADGEDTGKNLPIMRDERISWGGNVGVGCEWDLSRSLVINLGLRYHVFIGELRGADFYHLDKVLPIQFTDIFFALSYRFAR